MAEGGRGKPLPLPFGERAHVRFVEPHELRIERGTEGSGRARDRFLYAVKRNRVELFDDVIFAAQEALQLNVVVLLDIDTYRIEVRKLFAGGIVLPVIRIPCETQELAG